MKRGLIVALVAGSAVFARADGSSPWATCACDRPEPLPAGTTWAGGELSFTNRAANGGASFDFSALTNVTIRFADGEIAVDSFKFDPTCGLTFVGGAGTVLKGIADKSVFNGLSENANPVVHLHLSPSPQVVWSNLTFACDAEVRPVWRNGGAISICGGGFTIAGCTFSGCFCEEFGGAVYAPLLTDDSTVTNCTFEGSWVSAYNGYGGAIYASAATGGRKLTVVDSELSGNDAVNGGAICTVRAADDLEVPIALVLSDARFEDNVADYGGGAIFAEGAVTVTAAAGDEGGTVFSGNAAGCDGGAVCVSGIDGVTVPVDVVVGRGTVFEGNVASNRAVWTSGGAIAVLTTGCTFRATGVLFARNEVWTGAGACYGGAVSLSSGRHTLDTCVFDCRTAKPNASVYGGAVDFDSSDDVQIRNCSFRFAAVEAISAYNVGNLALTNCVVVGNGLIGAEYPDVFCEVAGEVSVAYTAYGSIWSDAALAADDFNLEDRTTDIYAGADTLKLDGTGFNPVAALGLVQPGVADFEGVHYGSYPLGYSMGAYETPTEPLVVTLDGSKNYDGNTSSNGCVWTWTLGDTNGSTRTWADLGEARQAFAITNWVFGNGDVGYYASTNATAATQIAAGVRGADARVEWLRRALEFVYTGTIRAASSSDIVLIFDPADYAWTGGPVAPTNEPGGAVTVVVSNMVTGAILVRDVDYELSWRDNVDPTDAAKIVVTGINNYEDASIVSNYFISAYCTWYFQDVDTDHPVPSAVVTNGALSGSSVVAAIDVPAGYCLDWQWPLETDHHTNGTVHVFGRGGAGREDILTLWVDYERDENVPGGDDVPDKYQERVVFAVVNGWWNGERNGADKVGWVTLYDDGGKWAVDGKGALSDVPDVGNKPFGGYEAGGAWNQDLAQVIDRSTFPIFLFGYARETPSVDPGRDRKPFLLAAARNDVSETSPMQNALRITDFAVDGADAVSGVTEAVVLDPATGAELATTELAGRSLLIYGAESPAGEWKPIANLQTDQDGGWSARRLRSFKFFKAVLDD